jgi:hypothetical protein
MPTGMPTQRADQREDESAFLMPPLHAPYEKGGITAGQPGGLDKVGSCSLPKPEGDQDGQSKLITK